MADRKRPSGGEIMKKNFFFKFALIQYPNTFQMSLKLCVYSKVISWPVSPIRPPAAILDFGLLKIPPEFSGGTGGPNFF